MENEAKPLKSSLKSDTMTTTTSTSLTGGEPKKKSILKSVDIVTSASTSLQTSEKQSSNFPTFRVDLRYRNTLPPIPFDPKFLEVPNPNDFLWGFRQSTLEKNYKYRIHMNPPQLSDDMIDPLGAEEWTKSIEYDERDKALQRKEGVDAKASRKFDQERESKTWLVKTVYTRGNLHRPSAHDSRTSQEFETSRQEEEETSPIEAINRQFDIANSNEPPTNIPHGKEIKRILPFLPARNLREFDLHVVRFKVGELITNQIEDDEFITKRAILLHRGGAKSEKRKNPFDPLSLFLPKKIIKHKKSSSVREYEDEEEDLFAAEEEEEETEVVNPNILTSSAGHTYDSKHVEYIRDYTVDAINAPNKNDRYAIFFGDDSIQYVELNQESLKLLRFKQKGDKDRAETEKEIPINYRDTESEEEKKDRVRRLQDIEGVA